MPLAYQGTLAEHRAVREDVGVFDVSHLGRFEVTGPGAHTVVSGLLCNAIDDIEPGRAQYTMLLTPDGGVVDDMIVWWLEDERFVLLPNAVNHETVLAAFSEAGATVSDLRPDTALLAVQGPRAPEIIEAVLGEAPRRFRTLETPQAVMAGTGYTGERGAEVMTGLDEARDLWGRFVEKGAMPCGLGARDTLRLEMGYPLWGNDLDVATTPLEAGLDWVIGWDHDFVGREALVEARSAPHPRELIGFALDSRKVPRPGHPLRCGNSTGSVTSGNFSPTLEHGIGLGYVAPAPGPDAAPSVEIRGVWEPARRVDPPFI